MSLKSSIFFNLFSFIFFLLTFWISISAQDPTPLPTPDEDEILKIKTELIQTGVSVFDKKGKFVNGLKKDDFDLRVDGKPVSVSFFESLSENLLSKNSTPVNPQENSKEAVFSPVIRHERTIIFVIDDIHLAFDSHVRTQKMLLKFIEQEKQPDDLVAIVSSSGKIGFLQQFTDNKIVLRAAVERLIFNKRSANDHGYPPMTEFEAQLIDHYDQEVTDKFALIILRDAPGTRLESARDMVRTRARTVLSQAAIITRNTFSVLEQAVRSSGQVAGRKTVFFISDGFLLDVTNTNSTDYLHRITDAAARVNAVIYSFDAKGLDASLPEGTAGSFRVQAAERSEIQDGMNMLANNTGGRFIHNNNDLQGSLANTLSEAAQFYLLAWEPEAENVRSEKLRKIQVSIKGQPELKVKVQSGYLDTSSKIDNKEGAKTETNQKKNSSLSVPEQKLNKVLISQIPVQNLPTSLIVNYAEGQTEAGNLFGFLQIKSEAIEFSQEADKNSANIDLVGVIYNSKGEKEDSFRKLITATFPLKTKEKNARPNIFYNFQNKLKPGLYQIRIAARDVKSGRLGSAIQWIEIPNLAQGKLSLSSILLSQRAKTQSTNVSAAEEISLNFDRYFNRSDYLQYTFFVYNFLGKNQPEITAQIQVSLNGKVIARTPEVKVPFNEKTPSNLAYAGEIPLNLFPSGHYDLQIIVKDKIAKSQTIQEVRFEVK